MTRRFFKAAALAALLAPAATAARAQTPGAPQTQNPTHLGRRLGGPREGGLGGRRRLRDLNLSDAQRQQVRDIEARYAQAFRPEREELRRLVEVRRGGGTLTPEQLARARQLREALRADAERMRAEIQNVLTPEQRQQIQQQRDEMKQRREQFREKREQFRERRQQLRQQRQNNNPPPAGNANGGQ